MSKSAGFAFGLSKREAGRGKSRRTLVHAEDRGEGFLGMVERAVAVVENADAVPELRVLLRGESAVQWRHRVRLKLTFGLGRR